MNSLASLIHWESTYERGLVRAQDTGKPLFLDFFKEG